MAMKFKAGDVVRHLPGAVKGYLTESMFLSYSGGKHGDTYVVTEVGPTTVALKGVPRRWLHARFEKVGDTLRIKEGETYRARNGQKIGPMIANNGLLFGGEWEFYVTHDVPGTGLGKAWRADGTFRYDRRADPFDLVAVWKDDNIPSAEVAIGPKAPPVKVLPGDKIRGSDWRYGHPAYTGRDKVGTVSHVRGGITYLREGGAVWADNVELIERIEKADGPAIVVRVSEFGKLEAAANPYIHPNRASAEAEAKRLAEQMRGVDFRVYSFTHLTTARAALPVMPMAQVVKVA
ncbi:hypothetical protein Ga0061061_11726 [Chelatococcus sambhunathii]|uniref:Uncharacterized protein n=1 Tax=Chelatococcus sambhunathii TaxID=363953 RepID=A0ABM9U9H1_9HYPH|nr:hypothetical protein [Chelatococcus sambhunathii]CUA90973.1 hypothetical protein Ga0061061_11726 [Chelatococcus sambhunathii]